MDGGNNRDSVLYFPMLAHILPDAIVVPPVLMSQNILLLSLWPVLTVNLVKKNKQHQSILNSSEQQ